MGVAFPTPAIESDLPVRAPRRKSRKQRIAGLVAALVLEGLVVLALLTLGTGRMADMAKVGDPLKTFDIAAPRPEPVVEVRKPETEVVAKTPQVTQPRPVDVPAVPTPEKPAVQSPSPQPAPLVQLSRDELATADLRTLPSSTKPAAKAGPPGPSAEADTPMVDGSGPNGEKLYAAAWYREPYDSELKGYLSTAQPGWATIACRTVADFRVDDCVAVAEWPRGSQLARAVLAAAWQFKVRPPRIGGQSQVGEWVRIRIDYGIKRRNAWER